MATPLIHNKRKWNDNKGVKSNLANWQDRQHLVADWVSRDKTISS